MSGTEPFTVHVRLYSISEISCFGLTLIFTESGFTAIGFGFAGGKMESGLLIKDSLRLVVARASIITLT